MKIGRLVRATFAGLRCVVKRLLEAFQQFARGGEKAKRKPGGAARVQNLN
jgi:hypothetical protein